MNSNSCKNWVLVILFHSGIFFGLAQADARQKLNFDKGWHFYLGTIEAASQKEYDDSDWQRINLPHDWSIEGSYDKNNPAGIRGGFLPTGIGWYRKNFDYDAQWNGKRIYILFDGVYMNSTVYINGKKLGTRPYGYIGFQYDLTDYLVEGKNTLAVKVDHSKAPSGRWYTGSGIYRHVYLLTTNQTHISRHGVQVHSKVTDKNTVHATITTRIQNHKNSSEKVRISQTLKDPQGEVVKTSTTDEITVDQKEETVQQINVSDALLWSAETPQNRYVLETKMIDAKGTVLDVVTEVLGFKNVEVSPDKGLVINGKKTIIKGMCMHHDAGPVGAAVPEDVLHRRLQLLKDMGCNAIRTSHNPFAPEFYEMCDEMGFYVMDEVFDGWETAKAKFDYGNYFEEWWEKDLTEFIRRDQNHPSVLFWSIGNEVRGFTDKRQHELVNFVKALDSTRLVSQGEGSKGTAIDIAGMNGHGEFKNAIADFHKEHPDIPIIGTEITHSYQTRGVYRTKTSYRRRDFPAPWERGKPFETIKNRVYLIPDLTDKEVFTEFKMPYQSSYDNSIVRMGIRDYWRVTRDKPYFLGAFRWTAFDYLGESFDWPARTAPFGILDLAGFPTDNYYLYQSIWSEDPMVHILPHWTHPGKENIKIPVVVYTNTGAAELFLNGESLGKKELERDALQLVWQVPYQPGELKVVAKTDTGKTLSKAYKTSGQPAAININSDLKELSYQDNDVAHLEISVVDKNDIFAPRADNELHLTVTGGGKLIGLENGDIMDLTPAKKNSRKVFSGKLLAMVQVTDKEENITIQVKGDGLKSSKITLKRSK